MVREAVDWIGLTVDGHHSQLSSVTAWQFLNQ